MSGLFAGDLHPLACHFSHFHFRESTLPRPMLVQNLRSLPEGQTHTITQVLYCHNLVEFISDGPLKEIRKKEVKAV